MNIIWVGNTAKVPTEHRKRAVVQKSTLDFDFDMLNVKRGGFLEDALKLYDGTFVNRANCCQVLLGLKALRDNQEALAILSCATNTLTSEHIKVLYNLIEDYISTLSISAKNAASTMYRHIYTRLNYSLKDGQLVSEVPFISRFPSDKKFEQKEKDGLLNQEKIILVGHEDDEELHAKVLGVLKRDLKKVEDACWDIIAKYKLVLYKHETVLQRIRAGAVKKLGAVSSMSQKECYEHYLHNILYGIERESLFEYENSAKVAIQRGCQFTNILPGNSFFDKVLSPDFRNIPHVSYEEVLLSYYLPKAVVEAIEVLFIIYTGWNPDVVISISEKNIVSSGNRYEITSVKSKNGQMHHITVIKGNHHRFHEIISIMLKNKMNINKYWKSGNDSLFCTWTTTQKKMICMPMTDSQHKFYILKPYGINHFSKKQLRDQKVNITYLETRDPFLVKEMLGHNRLETSLAYLNQHVIRLLHKANIRCFQDKLAASIIWSVKGEDEVIQRGLQINDIDRSLLFPVGRNSKNKLSRCDKWITSLGDQEIIIGKEDIKHLKWQRSFYLQKGKDLQQDNPKDFLLNHVPRMIFCFALYELVKSSRYSRLLENVGTSNV